MFADHLLRSHDQESERQDIVTDLSADMAENVSNLNRSPNDKNASEEAIVHVDLFTADEIQPYCIVSYQEYILAVRRRRMQCDQLISLSLSS